MQKQQQIIGKPWKTSKTLENIGKHVEMLESIEHTKTLETIGKQLETLENSRTLKKNIGDIEKHWET